MVKKYESIKGSYERDQDYLAAITVNGIWIKEKNLEKNNIIRASNLEKNNLLNLTIYEFDKNQSFVRRVEAESADITSTKWKLNNVKIIDNEGNYLSDNIENVFYVSIYDIKKIKSLYSNLDTISFWNIENEIKLLKERGYSTKEMRTKLQKSFAFPFFLLTSRKDKKRYSFYKYIFFIFGFTILVTSEITVRYSGISLNHTLIYYLLPLTLLPLIYIFLIRSFKYENLN